LESYTGLNRDEELKRLLADYGDLGQALSLKGACGKACEEFHFLDGDRSPGRYFPDGSMSGGECERPAVLPGAAALIAGRGFPVRHRSRSSGEGAVSWKTCGGQAVAIVSFLSGLAVRRPTWGLLPGGGGAGAGANCQLAAQGLASAAPMTFGQGRLGRSDVGSLVGQAGGLT